MNNLLQATIIKCADYLSKATNVGLSENYRDVYYLIDYLSHAVRFTYPQIPCEEKCSRCCSDSGLPRVTAIEWQIIHNYLINEMSNENKELVSKNIIDFYSNQVDSLLEENERTKVPYTKITQATGKPSLEYMSCPFLLNNSCSIYSARPSVCRAYGFFTIRVMGKSNIFTCQWAADKIITELREKGIDHWALPVWDKFVDKLYELNGDNAVSILPLWLLTHMNKYGKFAKKLNKNPDFNNLKNNFFIKK